MTTSEFPTSLADGRYLLVSPLGEGGMASVFRAYDQRLQTWRAVKILAPHLAKKKKLRARFEAEAHTMAMLEHRHIVRVYDVGTDGSFAYIVMEVVEGGCLVDWLEDHGAMPVRLAVEALIQVCEGVHAAHQKGIIHRDLKPHNVLITTDGVMRVTDFGIARVDAGNNSMTKTGAVMGTWGYMAPEQRTDAKSVDARADEYALGATLYSLVTNKTPMDLFAADRDDTMMEGVPFSLVEILIKATEYRREDRYETVRDFQRALEELLPTLPAPPEGSPPIARPAKPPPPVPNAADYVKVAGTAGELNRDTSLASEDNATIAPDFGTDTIAPFEDVNHTLIPDGLQGTPSGGHPQQQPPHPSSMAGTVASQYGYTEHGTGGIPIPTGYQQHTTAPAQGGGLGIWALAMAVVFVAFSVLIAVAALVWTQMPKGEVPVEETPIITQVVETPPVDTEVKPDTDSEEGDSDASNDTPTPPAKQDPPLKADPPPKRDPIVKPPPVETKVVTPPKTDPVKVVVPKEVVEVPPASSQCLNVKPPRLNPRARNTFQVTLCESDASATIRIFYRRVGDTRWESMRMASVMGKYFAHVTPSDDSDFVPGIEYYVTGAGQSYGGPSSPMVVK